MKERDALDAALADGDVLTALDIVDRLDDADARSEELLQIWMLAGHVRLVTQLLPGLTAASQAVARAFIDDPGARDEAPDSDYHMLDIVRVELAKKGRVRALARVHLAMAERSPRPDWRWIHVDHAGSLAMTLGDVRLEALVLGFEAMRDADFGEDDDALERVDKALALAAEADEPRARALAEAARAIVVARQALAGPSEPAWPESLESDT